MVDVGCGFKKISEFYDVISTRYNVEQSPGPNLPPYSDFFQTAGFSNDVISSVKLMDTKLAGLLEGIVQKVIPILLFTG